MRAATKKAKYGVVGAVAILVSSCALVDPSRGLANYFRLFLDSNGIAINEIDAGMFPSSRMGYFIFSVEPQEFTKLRAALSLKPITSLEAMRDACLNYGDKFKEAERVEFDIWSPGFKPDDADTWVDRQGNDVTPTKSSIGIYYAEPPLAPMNGNSRSSFDHLFYDSITGTCVAILEYPYG